MKLYSYLLLAVAFALSAVAEAKPVRNAEFVKTIYLATPSGSASGTSYGNAKALGTDADLMTIQPGMEVQNVYVIVDEAVLGVTSVAVGDDDSGTGFLPVAATDTYLATPQILGYPSTVKGTYLKDGSNNPASKYYSASGKEVKADFAGTLGATGKMRVIIKGMYHAHP